jgi:glycine cleavage system regulatory protein
MKQKVFALVALLALSCKAEHRMDSPKPAAPVATDAAARAVPASFAAGAEAPALPRLIIRTAEVTLIVGDTTASVERLAALASANGGYLTDSKIWRDGQQVRATLTIRVPATKLDAALAAIRKVATRVESETVSGDDVTQEFVDLESQVRNLEAAEVEMRQLMTTVRERTKKAEDILQVYEQLVQLRGQIETAKGRMRYLSQMSAMSTIKLTLTPDAITKPVVEPGWQPVAVAKDASRALLKTAEAATDVVIWALVYFGPLLLMLAGMLFVTWRVIARRRRAGLIGAS